MQFDPHVPLEQTCWAVHWLPQAPQLLLSVCSFAQYAAAPTGVQSVWPLAHVEEQLPVEHTCSAPHSLPHEPQLLLSVCSSVQYGVPPSGLHKVDPLPQLAAQLPDEQTCPAGHVFPQPPQLLLSVCSLAQYSPEPPSTLASPLLGVQTFSPGAQLIPHVPAAQIWPAEHCTPQPPQLALSVCTLAQYAAPASTPHVV